MSRTLLGIVAVVMVVVGIVTVGGWWTAMVAPAWYSWVEIVVGVVALAVVYSDGSKEA